MKMERKTGHWNEEKQMTRDCRLGKGNSQERRCAGAGCCWMWSRQTNWRSGLGAGCTEGVNGHHGLGRIVKCCQCLRPMYLVALYFFSFSNTWLKRFFFPEDFYSMLTLRDFLAHRSKQTYGKKMNPIRPLDRTLLVAPTPSPMRPRPAVSSEGPLFRSSHTVCIYTWFNNILPPFFYICRS